MNNSLNSIFLTYYMILKVLTALRNIISDENMVTITKLYLKNIIFYLFIFKYIHNT